MKKLLCISGIITVLFLILLLSGWAYADSTPKEATRQGNEHYAAGRYGEALSAYETGLVVSPENKTLNFNAAQTAYILGEYEKAASYYMKAGDSIEKFLNFGNSVFKLGEATSDANQQMEYYMQALQIYLEGITKYPQDVPLKYNFETLKKIIEELMQNQEQQGEDGESQEDSEDGESQEQQGEDSESQEQQDEDSESQEQQGENSESQEESGEEQSQAQESQEGNSDDEQQESYAQDEAESTTDQEAIERILEMLESQEETSLKNNQGVVGGKDGKNGW